MVQSTRRRALPSAAGGSSAAAAASSTGNSNGMNGTNGSVHGPAHPSSTTSTISSTSRSRPTTSAASAAGNGAMINGAPKSGGGGTSTSFSLPGRVRPPSRRSSVTDGSDAATAAKSSSTLPTARRKRRAMLRTRRRLAALANLFGINFYDARHSQAARIVVICLVLTAMGFVGILISVLRSGVSGRVEVHTRSNGEISGMADGVPLHHGKHRYHHRRNHDRRDHPKIEIDNNRKKDSIDNDDVDMAADRPVHEGAGDGEDDDAAEAANDGKNLNNEAGVDTIDADVTQDRANADAAAAAKKDLSEDAEKKSLPKTRKDKEKGTAARSNQQQNPKNQHQEAETISKAEPSGKIGAGNTAGSEKEARRKDVANSENPVFKVHFEGAPPCTNIQPRDVSYTLVTQLSTDRIWMMRQHCTRWGLDAPISVVVYTDRPTEEIIDLMVAEGCNRDHLAVQTLSTKEYPETEYPVNRMRNMALSAVRTTHVMYVDVDFWEAGRLREVLEMDSVREELAKDHKLAAVVPAFQIMRQCKEYRDCRDENIAKMPNTTQQMMDLVTAAQAGAFDPTNRGGHGSTSYGAWYLQKEGEMYDIPCFKSNRYEPYLAFRYCEELPPFQEQFTGYGKNKLTWVMQLRRMGWDFSQLGQIFLVHYPHLDSKSRLEWNEGPKKIQDPVKGRDGKVRRREPREVKDVDWSQYQRGQVDQLYVEFRDWLNNDLPDDSRVHPCKDAVDDDSMLWINKEA
mmetsp:Transcript_25667/g.56205  ORF Transcript_25667/g.56205 Transcript_25667/m.56205 type:complete len:739 (+) Transcript_25667:97-2313(+)